MIIEVGELYWLGGRTFMPGKIGHKYVHGLVIEADGVHALKVSLRERLKPVMMNPTKRYPASRVRGHLRKLKPQSQAAKELRATILEQRS